MLLDLNQLDYGPIGGAADETPLHCCSVLIRMGSVQNWMPLVFKSMRVEHGLSPKIIRTARSMASGGIRKPGMIFFIVPSPRSRITLKASVL